MDKNFDEWNKKKQVIHNHYNYKLYHEGEIWWCLLGANIGKEHDGDKVEHQRPVLILKGLSAQTCFILPLTSSTSKHPLRVPVGVVEDKVASTVLSQLRVIDTKRLAQKICLLDRERFDVTRKAIKDLL